MRTKLGFGLAILLCSSSAFGVQLRKQVTQHGDFSIIGNTSGFDCSGSSGTPVVGTVGACGLFSMDTGDDVFWKSNDPSSASADLTVTAFDARSTAVLTTTDLPMGAKVTYARLYWGAVQTTVSPNATVVFERPNVFMQNVTADNVTTINYGGAMDVGYQATADVTQLVQQNGVGPYRLSKIDSLALNNLNDDVPYIGWSLVVVYELASLPLNAIAVYDGLSFVNNNDVDTQLTGFLIPMNGAAGKLGVIGWETDTTAGDGLAFDGKPISDAQNPANNFFNGTHSRLGSLVSVAGDLPQMTGAPGTMSGMDIDIVDISSLLTPNATMATLRASSSGDSYGLGVVVTSVASRSPSFAGSTKVVRNLTRNDGTTKKGDVLEYTITIQNTGSDTALDTRIDDPLPTGLVFNPNSLEIVSGAGIGMKTDQVADDQGEFASNTVTFRVGTGANGSMGGVLAPNESTQVRFKATVAQDAMGTIKNQGKISARGQGGSPTSTTVTSSNRGPESTTDVIIDQGCKESKECPEDRPICDPVKHECRPCMPSKNNEDCAPLGGTCIDTGPNAGRCTNTGLSLEGGGCACDVGSSGSSPGLIALAGLALTIALRRRRSP